MGAYVCRLAPVRRLGLRESASVSCTRGEHYARGGYLRRERLHPDGGIVEWYWFYTGSAAERFRTTVPGSMRMVTETENHILMTEESRYLKNR